MVMGRLGIVEYRIKSRGERANRKIKQLNEELVQCENEIKETPPGPAQEAVRARAKGLIKKLRMCDRLYNQTLDLDEVTFAQEAIEDARQTVCDLKSADRELNAMMKNLQDHMKDMADVNNNIQESLRKIYNVPDSLVDEVLNKEFGPASGGHAVPAPKVKKEVRVKKEVKVKKEAANGFDLSTALKGTVQNPIMI